ncbi:hypothetical protein Pan153_15790 [Gimesia panareensis]|uniref:Uncharacterized protein n=1 Tax=Gimesia panareensis TaxID=2527978 RepID=A0A518FKV6_9PLAN|nr:hypothetical protein [Gimesia panareensis]QDV16945.1 hypothetical protein Pan153_15790 [Gimesia panareensis]
MSRYPLFLLLVLLVPSGCASGNVEEGKKFVEFPWPPPKASAQYVIPETYFQDGSGKQVLVKDVDQKICDALTDQGYSERSYFAVPGGFALVTRLEQFDKDGKSKTPPDRWVTDMAPMREFSLGDYIRALFTASPGYYRVIVFIVTPVLFDQTDQKVEREEAMAWLRSGLNSLPDDVGAQEYSESHECTALIYEFKQPAKGTEAEINLPGQLSGLEHLTKAGLLEGIKQQGDSK